MRFRDFCSRVRGSSKRNQFPTNRASMILKIFPKECASSQQEQQIKCGMVVTLSDLGFQRWHGLRHSPTLGFTHIETPTPRVLICKLKIRAMNQGFMTLCM